MAKSFKKLKLHICLLNWTNIIWIELYVKVYVNYFSINGVILTGFYS